jgi:membrane-bound lytic murein transglycosylase B
VTLSFDYLRRAEFYRRELVELLLLAREQNADPLAFKGSFAGAIGLPQFMPGSIRRFAVDFDGDGRADLVSSSEDALASTASYLAGHGWKPHAPFAEGTPNFAVLGEWNASEVVRKAIVLFASKLEPRR